MKGMTMEWQNPSPVARYCTGCGCPMICGRQVSIATTAAEMDDTNTWAMCPVCGATWIDTDGSPVWAERTKDVKTPELFRERTCGECAWRGDAQRSPGVWQTYCRLAAIWAAIAVDMPACPAFVARGEEQPHKCAWKQYSDFDDMDGVYKTECGHLWEFTEGDIADNDTHYCPYCGGQIVEQPTEGEGER